jgi:SAM-dependent methyltransferase
VNVGYNSSLYERIAPSWPEGVPIRPGGLALTERALSFCTFSSGDRLLDVGCGTGATLEWLIGSHGFQAFGVDPSPVLLKHGLGRNRSLPLVSARGEDLPFRTDSRDGVLLECSLSVSHDRDKVLRECRRVLKDKGKLVLSDVFVDGKPDISGSGCNFFSVCTAGAMPKERIQEEIRSHGFEVMLWEDHSAGLAPFIAQLLLCCDFQAFNSPGPVGSDFIGRRKGFPGLNSAGSAFGYFLLVAEKTSGVLSGE